MRPSFVFVLVSSSALCLFSGVCAALLLFDIPAHELAESWALRSGAAALVVTLVVMFVQALLVKDLAKGLITIAVLMGLFSIGMFHVRYLDGVLHLGEGENARSWVSVQRGLMARYPSLTFLKRTPEGIRVQVDEELVDLPHQQWTDIGDGLSVRVEGIYDAPAFVISSLEGEVLHEGLIKIQADSDEDQFIRVGFLPHRFYLSRRGEGLHLMVLRGKLVAVESDIVPGQKVEFEGMTFSIGEGSYWAEIHLRSTFGWIVPSLALLMLAVGLVWRQRS
jgi:hypothetical protein